MEGQLVSMINELRQGELDFTINTYYQGLTTMNLRSKSCLKNRLRYFAGKGIRRQGQHPLMNFCIITGQCRRRGEAIISN